MTFRKVVIIVCLLFLNQSLFAQATDTLHHVDTTNVPSPSIQIDTPVIVPASPSTSSTPPAQSSSHSGYLINGKVEDMNTGEGIPFAVIYFPHSNSGTSADLNGNFIIKTDKLPSDTLHIE